MKRLIFDLDNTITLQTDESLDYSALEPNTAVVSKMNEYKLMGFDIVVATSRNMRTFSGNVGKINILTLPIIIKWLDDHCIPYDEVYVGKPWCGHDGFYIDDRSIRPNEFVTLSYEEILELIGCK